MNVVVHPGCPVEIPAGQQPPGDRPSPGFKSVVCERMATEGQGDGLAAVVALGEELIVITPLVFDGEASLEAVFDQRLVVREPVDTICR